MCKLTLSKSCYYFWPIILVPPVYWNSHVWLKLDFHPSMNSLLLRIVCSSLSFACFACTAQKVTANAEQPYVRPQRAMIRLVTTPPTGCLFCSLRSACRTLVVVTAAINRGLNFLLSQDLQGFFCGGAESVIICARLRSLLLTVSRFHQAD